MSDSTQTLPAAFQFGITLQASIGGLLLFYKGHGKTIFKDGRRLVLVLFFFFAFLWAQIEFLNLMLPPIATGICQATLFVSTAFDQISRVGIEQFLLWSVGHGTKLTKERLILQGVLLLRLIGGGLLVGFTRPQFAPTCVATTSVTPIAIVVLALDGLIVGVLLVRAISLGMFGDIRNKKSEKKDQSMALVLSIFGFGLWTAASVPMILGISTFMLVLRTVVPATGLLILMSIVTIYPGAILSVREDDATIPEASSPFMNNNPLGPSRVMFDRDITSNDGSPIVGHGYTKSGSLFVVNPSTPNDSPIAVWQGGRGDTRGFTKLNEEISIQEITDIPTRPQRPERLTKNLPGYRGSSGVFPSLLAQDGTGALAPQIRPAIRVNTNTQGPPGPAAVTQQKKGFFNRSKPTKTDIRSRGISQPISLNVENNAVGDGAFAKMQTIDLATAATNERERRAGAAARAQLLASSPAPQPPLGSTLDGLRQSVSVKRKETQLRDTEPMPTIPGSTGGTSIDGANGSTTSASLSPGRDEVRRRSPRSGNPFNQGIDGKSRDLPSLQRKQTMGLPSGPGSLRRQMPQEVGTAKNEAVSVMLMNDIVYDNPGVVKTIISGAPGMYAKRPKTASKESFSSMNSLSSSGSIIHRPRPYKRDQSKDRQFFPTEPSPGHKRSKSGGSIASKKSFFRSTPGSPTQLPPLPPPPTSAAKLTRLLPNNTKSMTFDEKIELLFPAPPGVETLKRRSSVPSLPRMPSVFVADTPMHSPVVQEDEGHRRSKRTTIASFDISNSDILASSPKNDLKAAQDRQTYRFSANTYGNLVEETDGLPTQDVKSQAPASQSHLKVPTRRSVIDDLRKSKSTETTTSDGESLIDDASSFWGSIHSETPAIDLQKAMMTAQATYIKRTDMATCKVGENRSPLPTIEVEEAMIPVMLDEQPRRSILVAPKVNRQSFFLDADQSLAGDKSPSIRSERSVQMQRGVSWHRRIGDELPTFSERDKPRSRKMPPPTPLLLSKKTRQATVVVRNAEPSPPSDSPERAIKEIQDQLRRFEEPQRESVGSLLQRLPSNAKNNGYRGVSRDQDRMALLDNLEAEIDQQENHWQQMQSSLNRDSMSTIMTPQQSEHELSRESSQKSRTPISIKGRRTRIISSVTVRSKTEDSTRTSSTESSENSRASIWQQRLADAQEEYMSNAPEILRKKSLNFLHVSKSQTNLSNLGSPTPPESVESETEIDSASESEEFDGATSFDEIHQQKPSLWQAPESSTQVSYGYMWTHPVEKSTATLPEPPATSLRRAQRRNEQVMRISSGDLWCKPRSLKHSQPAVALWSSKIPQPRSTVSRPVTQRPARKSKRVTFLPDIVENPVPLPNKSDTLGIFQFPWGEKSDQPVWLPTFKSAQITGPHMSNKLDVRSHQLEPESSEYSSSFFDDYEEEEEDDEDMVDPESDDDFDESTLWEIANLLNSKDVPSKQSLLPPARESVENNIAENEDASTEEIRPQEMRLPIQPLTIIVRDVATASPPVLLWAQKAESTSKVANGLAQPSPKYWNSLLPTSSDVIRSKVRISSALPTLASKNLWTASKDRSPSTNVSAMWRVPASGLVIKVPVRASLNLLWAAPKQALERSAAGLFSPPAEGTLIRNTSAMPAATKIAKAARQVSSNSNAPEISSRNLWAPIRHEKKVVIWILGPKPSMATAQAATISMLKPQSAIMWKPAPKMESASVTGLFNATIPRLSYRSSDLSPAAISMVRKARASQYSLTLLSSTKLWTRRQRLNIERDWISESSIRPESPSVYSPSSSRSSSPTSDAASVRSNSTKASSVFSFVNNPSLIPQKAFKKDEPSPSVNNAKKAFKLPAMKPAEDGNHVSKLPVLKLVSKLSKPEPKPLASIRESRVFAARDMFESKGPSAEKAPARNFLRRKTTIKAAPKPLPHRALRHQFMQPVAFRANWDEALAEAIVASYIRPVFKKEDWSLALAQAVAAGALKELLHEAVQIPKRRVRPAFKEEDWRSALAQAIAAGTPRFTVMRLGTTKADWEAALASAVAKSETRRGRPVSTAAMWHNALASAVAKSVVVEESQVQKYDPAVLHPVFFTGRLVSNVIDVHPASVGHVIKNYDTSSVHPVFFTESRVPRVSDMHPASIGYFSIEAKPSTKMTVSPMWTPVSKIIALQTATLWAKNSHVLRPASATMTQSKKPARKPYPPKVLDLPGLESNAIWKPSEASKNEKNWIVSSSAPRLVTQKKRIVAKVVKPSSAQTWNPRAVPAKAIQGTMWTKSSTPSPVSPDQFSKIQNEHIRASTIRPVALPMLVSHKLFTPAPVAKKTVNWIMESSKLARTQSLTWKASSQKKKKNSTSEDGMWTARAKQMTLSVDVFAHVKHDHLRTTPSRSNVLPVLVSSKLFAVVGHQQRNTHWLHQTSKDSQPVSEIEVAPVAVFAPKQRSATSIPTQEAKGMWVATPVVSRPTSQSVLRATVAAGSTRDFFSHIKHAHIHATTMRSTPLPQLTSNSLFVSSSKISSTRDWLETTCTRRQRSMTWNAPTKMSAKTSGAIWTATTQDAPLSPELFTHIKHNIVRGSNPRFVSLPQLESLKLFAISSKSVESPDWLHSTSMRQRSMTWNASTAKSVQQLSQMWTMMASKFDVSTPELFAHIKHEHVRRSTIRSADLPQLSSTTLFSVATEVVESPDWLHTTSASVSSCSVCSPTTSVPSSHAMTWTATPVVSHHAASSTTLWTSTSINAAALFANPHAEPWVRAKRSEQDLVELERV